MKKVIIIIISVLSILSFNNRCEEDAEFKRIYHKMLDTIMFYGKQFDVDEDEDVLYVIEMWERFSDYSDYLRLLTQHKFRYNIIEIPIYDNQSDLEADIKDLKKWYEENKCGLTREKADSIIKANYEKKTGRKESDLFTYILSVADE